MTVWSLQTKALYWTDSGILTAFSGDSGHRKIQTDLLILKCISNGNSKVETAASIHQVCRSAVRLLPALQICLFQELHNRTHNVHYIFSKEMRLKGGHIPHPVLYTKFLIAEMVWNKLWTLMVIVTQANKLCTLQTVKVHCGWLLCLTWWI